MAERRSRTGLQTPQGNHRRQQRSSALSRIEDVQNAVGSRVRVRIVIGLLKDSMILAARQLGAAVLTVGRGPQSRSHGRMCDLTHAAVRNAPCPALSV